MDPSWKHMIQFAYDMVCVATLPIHSFRDRENAFRFVRSELIERYVDPLDEALIQQQQDFIRSVFAPGCGGDVESEDEGYESER